MGQEQIYKGAKYTKTIIIIAALTAYFFIIFSESDLPFQLYAALIGVIITVTITAFLLNNQTELQQIFMVQQKKAEYERQLKDREFQNQLQKDKQKLEQQSKVFEKKLEIYQEYLQKLCDAIEDGKLSKKEKLELQFHTSYIAMHTTPDHIIKISESVKDILQKGCGNATTEDNFMHLESLFKIVQCFREELYYDDKDNMLIDAQKMAKTRLNFEEAYSGAEEAEEDIKSPVIDIKEKPLMENETNPIINEISKQNEVNLQLWNEAIKKWGNDGLTISKNLENDNELFIDLNHGQRANIRVLFWRGNYIIQADYYKSGDLSQYLKWEMPPGVNNSKRSYWQWWTTGNDDLRAIPNGELFNTLSHNRDLQQYIINIIDDLILKMRMSRIGCEVRTELDEKYSPDYSIWEWPRLYEFSTLYSDYDTKTEEGKIFIDLYDTRFSEHYEEYKEKPILIIMYNREKDEEKLKRTLNRIGISNAERSINNRILLESFTANTPVKEIAEKLNYWMNRILIK